MKSKTVPAVLVHTCKWVLPITENLEKYSHRFLTPYISSRQTLGSWSWWHHRATIVGFLTIHFGMLLVNSETQGTGYAPCLSKCVNLMLEFDHQYKFEVFFHLSRMKNQNGSNIYSYGINSQISLLATWLAAQQLRNKGSFNFHILS